MKKFLTVLCLCIISCLCFTCSVCAIGSVKVVINKNVKGYIGQTIGNQEVELTLDDSEQYTFNVEQFSQNQDITSWFTNIPEKCNYKATVNSVTAEKLTVMFTGEIGADASELETNITLTIPYTPDDESTLEVDEEVCYVLQNGRHYIDSISNIDNTNAKYIIEDQSVLIQYKGPYEVKGTVGEELEPQIVEVVITEGNEEFDYSILDQYLPDINGLTPQVTHIDDETYLEITITYTGTPLEPSQDLIHTTISKDYLLTNIVDRVVPDRADVKFNIVPKEIPVVPVIVDDKPTPKPIFTLPKTGIN